MLPSVKTLKLLKKRVFQLLIFFLPTQLAYHIWPDWSLVFGIRVDYLSPAVYLTDILLVLLLGLWLLTKKKIEKKEIVISTFLLVFALANLLVAKRFEPAFYKWVKIFALSFFSLLIAKEKGFNYKEWLAKPLKLSLVLISLIGIFQFLFQRTVGGPLYYLGERDFSSVTPGIALINIFGRPYLRSYSVFSHPNSFGGFLLVSLTLLYWRNKQIKSLDVLVIALSLIALVLTFSKASMVVAIFLLTIYLVDRGGKPVGKKVKTAFLAGAMALSTLMPVVISQLGLRAEVLGKTFAERVGLAEASGEMVSERPLFGVGLNNFIVLLPETSQKTEYSWDLQPVHNIFLLALSETGVAGFILLFLVGRHLIRTKNDKIFFSLIVIILTGMVDHYWLTLQQNMFLLFAVAGLSLRQSKSSF